MARLGGVAMSKQSVTARKVSTSNDLDSTATLLFIISPIVLCFRSLLVANKISCILSVTCHFCRVVVVLVEV